VAGWEGIIQSVDHGIRLVRRGGVAHVAVRGEHDVFTASTLRQKVHSVLGDRMPVVVDLQSCTALDSTVLAVLLGAARRAEENDLPFALVVDPAPQSPVRRVFDLAGLATGFPVYDDLDEAVSAVGAPHG
jgi:anti-sigma B factor antagonist